MVWSSSIKTAPNIDAHQCSTYEIGFYNKYSRYSNNIFHSLLFKGEANSLIYRHKWSEKYKVNFIVLFPESHVIDVFAVAASTWGVYRGWWTLTGNSKSSGTYRSNHCEGDPEYISINSLDYILNQEKKFVPLESKMQIKMSPSIFSMSNFDRTYSSPRSKIWLLFCSLNFFVQ